MLRSSCPVHMTSEVVALVGRRMHHWAMSNSTPPKIIISPAMAVPARAYRRLLGALDEIGWSADVAPRRGIEEGDTAPSRAVDWSFNDEVDDLAAAVRTARNSQPDQPVLVLGHSFGAQLGAALLTGETPIKCCPDGLITVGASVPHFRHFPRLGLRELAVAEAVSVGTAIAGYWPKPGFGAPTPRTLMRQWARMVYAGKAPFPVDGRITIPTLAVRLDDDDLVPVRAAEHFERAVTPEHLETWTYGRADCPVGGSIGHIGWLRTPRPVVEKIQRWARFVASEGLTRRTV